MAAIERSKEGRSGFRAHEASVDDPHPQLNERPWGRLAAMAARLTGAPIGIIHAADNDAPWFNSHYGIAIDEISAALAHCATAEPLMVDPGPLDPAHIAEDTWKIARNGDEHYRFCASVPLLSARGYRLGTLCVLDTQPREFAQDAVEHLEALAALAVDLLETKIARLRQRAESDFREKEIDHRVMNSLQFVSSLLTMQSRETQASDVATHLMQAASRVSSVAHVHRQLHMTESAGISTGTFLRELCDDLENILSRSIATDTDDFPLTSMIRQPLSILVNELVTNAAKHGEGRIEVRYRAGRQHHSLSVSDEGRGVPDQFDPDSPRASFGMQVIAFMVRQLDGDLTVGTGPRGGASFEVRFLAPGAGAEEGIHATY